MGGCTLSLASTAVLPIIVAVIVVIRRRLLVLNTFLRIGAYFGNGRSLEETILIGLTTRLQI